MLPPLPPLSSLPLLQKLGGSAIVLGALLPTLLFAVVLLLLFNDQPLFKSWIDASATPSPAQSVYLFLAVSAVVIALWMLIDPLYRLIEGYNFPKWLGEPLKKRNRRRLQSQLGEAKALYDEWSQQDDNFAPDKIKRYTILRQKLAKWMPSRENEVLPTSFGNAITAFEVYPRDIYGADGIVIWLRLASVMPKAFTDQIQGVRSQIDFLVSCCFLSAIVSLLGFGRAAYSGSWCGLGLHTVEGVHVFFSSIEKTWLFWMAGGALASYLFYLRAVALVPAWGDLVMSAFDCYLPALARQLGFEPPTTDAERREFWTTFSQQLIYRREPDGETPFRIEKWKQAQSTIVNMDMERANGSQDSKAPETDDKDNSEDDLSPEA